MLEADLIDEIKAPRRKGTMSPFFLQGKDLGPSLVALLTTKKMENGDERTLCKSTQW